MPAIRPLFRLTVYAPASEDPTETTVLTPIAGAAHSDPFVVTTMQGIAGSQPYLAIGLGRQGQLDYVSKKTTTGNLKLSVFDPRVTAGGANAVRWSTAFLGDALGQTRAKGCKFLLERSLDGTVGALVPFTAGRIRNTSVSRAQWLDLDVKDFADDLNRPLFTGQPHSSVTYASLGPLFPNGLVKPFGHATLTPPLAATIGAAFATAPNTVVVNLTSPSDPAAMITQAVLDSNGSDDLRLVELTVVSTGVKHYYQWPRGDSALASTNIGGGPTPHFGLTAFPIAVLPATDARTEALPAVGTAVTVSIVVDAPPTEATPLLVDDVHPVQYLADLIDGKFSMKPGTTTLHPLGTRNSGAGGSWATLLADASFGTMRDLVTQLEPKANEYIEKTLLQRFNLALVRDGSGNLDVADPRRSASLAGVATLTDDDLVTADDVSWDDSRDGAITAVAIDYWLDHYAPVTDLVASGDTFPTLSPSLIKAVKSTVLIPNDLSTLKDVGEKVVKIESKADRISTGDWGFAHFGRQRVDLVKARLAQVAADFLRPIGTGTITARATYRLGSTNAQLITVGQYFIVQHTKLPNPAANQRGGSRLMLCLSADERDGKKLVQWLDAGTGAVATTPSITSVTSANAYSVDVTLAANAAGDPMLVHVAVTATSVGTHPAEDAAEWIFAAQTAAGTIHIANLPQGKRVWVRAQSYGNAPNTKLPSAWVYAAYLDLAAGTDVDLSPPEPTWTPIDSLASASLSDIRQTDGSSTSTITWVRGSAVAEVWGASAVVAVPLDVSDWTPIVGALAPLASDSIVVPKPADGQATLVQLVPYRADGTAGTVVRRVLYGVPQVPTAEYDDLEDGATGTQFVALTERGIAVASVEAQVQYEDGSFTDFAAPTRGPGAASTVRGGTLAAGQYEEDAPLSSVKGRQTFIRFRWTLVNGIKITSPDFAFDADRLPNLLSVVVDGTTVRATGDSDTKSMLVGRSDGAWQVAVDGKAIAVDVSQADPDGTAGLASGDANTFAVQAWNVPAAFRVGAPVPGRAFDEKVVRVANGAIAGDGSTVASWLIVQASAPTADGVSSEITIGLKANAAPSGWTVKLLISTDGSVPTVDRTSAVSPSLSAPPTTLTSYTWDTGHACYAPGGLTPTALLTVRVKAQLLDGSSAVRDTRDVEVSFYTDRASL